MGTIKPCLPVKLFAGITYHPAFDIESFIRNTLSEELGDTDFRSETFAFSAFTNYYEQEMGSGLEKVFISFSELVMPDKLPVIKTRTNRLESRYTSGKGRYVNIDPGYLTMAKVVLATTKDYSHRIYLMDGIYGDLHLTYSGNSYQKQPWTYPDYQQPPSIVFFNQLRKLYSQQLAGVEIETNDV